MPKKIYKMKLNEFKQLMRTAINEVVPTLIPPEMKRFKELENKKETGSLTPEERNEYFELLAKRNEKYKKIARKRTDDMIDQIVKLYGGDSDKSLDEMFEDDDENQHLVIYQRDEPHGYAARKFQSKLEKVPGLEDLIAAIKQKGDAAVVLKDLAMAIGGDKLRADQVLAKAYRLAKDSMEEEALYESAEEKENTSFNSNSQVHGSAAKKFQSKMEKVPGLETLIAAIKQKGDAAVVLKDLAKEIGGDKLQADQILAKAYSLAKKEK
jgi:hypothetical protein